MHLRLIGDPAALAGAYVPERLTHALGDDLALAELTVAASLDSTNREALDRCAAQPREIPIAVLADSQTGGRGRRGRRWESPAGCNLYLSLAWRSELPLSYQAGLLPLVIGVAAADALAGNAGVDVGLKWPNDLYLAGGKLGGILLESRVHGREVAIVAGIGINHRHDARLAQTVEQPVRFLDALAPDLSREALAAALIRSCVRRVAEFREQGWASLADAWTRRDLLRDQPVAVADGQAGFRGVARGITGNGELRVETPDGLRICRSGDVSVRPS